MESSQENLRFPISVSRANTVKSVKMSPEWASIRDAQFEGFKEKNNGCPRSVGRANNVESQQAYLKLASVWNAKYEGFRSKTKLSNVNGQNEQRRIADNEL